MAALARNARAQACCTATGSNELGVVGRCHLGVIAAQLSYEHAYGSYDGQNRYRRLEGARAHDWVLGLGAGVRLGSPALQISASAPFRLQYRRFEGVGGGVAFQPGDASAALRAMVLEDLVAGIDRDPATWVPFVELIAGVTAPTGRPPDRSRTPTGVDATGNGSWMASGGAKITKFVTLHDAVSLSAVYGHRFSREASSPGGVVRQIEPGDELNATLSSLHVLNLYWAWGILSSLRWTGSVEEDGRRLPDSSLRRLRFGAFLEHYLRYPTWQLTASLLFDPPADGFGRNIPFAGAMVSLTLARNFTY